MYLDKKKKKTPFDTFQFGTLVGIIIPVITLLIIYSVKIEQYKSIENFYNLLLTNNALTSILSLSVLPNLGAFYLFLNKHLYLPARGVIFATLLFALLVFGINFL
jgi:hypothetical protein